MHARSGVGHHSPVWIWDRARQQQEPQKFADEDRVSYLRSLVFTFGEFEAADELVDPLMAAGRFSEAVIVAHHVTSDRYDLLARLDHRLDTPELLTRAITQLERCAADAEQDEDPGDYENAADALAALLHRRGLLDQLLTRADAGDFFASFRAADILVDRGRADEAIRVLEDQADRDGPYDEMAREKAVRIEQNRN